MPYFQALNRVSIALAYLAACAGWLTLSGCDSDAWFGNGPGASVEVETPTGVQAGDVEVVYTLTGDVLSTGISVTFSVDGGSFRDASSASGGDGTEDLSVDPAGQTHLFVWDSAKDLEMRRESSVIFRVRPEDSSSVSTDPFRVFNSRFLAAVEEGSTGKARLFTLNAVDGESELLASVDTGGTDAFDILFQESYFLVVHETSHNVAVLKLDEENETLTSVAGSPFTVAGTGSKYLASDGDHVFVANTLSETVSILDFNSSTGALSTGGHADVAAASCRSMVAWADRLYVASESADEILIFDIESDGDLVLNAGSPADSGGLATPRALALAGSRLYAASSGGASISAFQILGDGSLSAIAGSPFAISSAGIEQLNGTSTRLFAVTGSGETLLSFAVSALGALTEDIGSPLSLTGPSYAVASTSKFVMAATTTSRNLETWTFDGAGALTAAASSPQGAGASIVRIALSD